MAVNRRIRIRLHFSFLVFNAIVFSVQAQGVLLRFYIVCALHEAAHIAAAALLGSEIVSVDITGLGIRMSLSGHRMSSVFSDILVLSAGPAANLTIYSLLTLSGHSDTFALLNLAAAVYNLLPYSQLDGGAIILQLVSGTPREAAALRLLSGVRAAFSAILLIALLKYGVSLLPLFIFSLLLLVSEQKQTG